MTALLLTAAPDVGDAAESDSASTHKSPHTEETSWLIGIKGVQLSAFPEDGEALFGAGFGAFVERSLIPGWVEVELSASVVRIEAEEAWIVPIDLLLKKPFHFGDFCPYIAVGPTVVYVGGEERAWFAGGAAVVGAYLWLNEAWGIDFEVDYAIVDENGIQHELTVAAGPTLRF